MTNWNIGIDESGHFNWYNPDDKSFVCAIVTKASEEDSRLFLEKCASIIDNEKYRLSTTGLSDDEVFKNVLKNFYHGMDVAKDQSPEALFKILRTLLSYGSEFFKNTFISKPGSDYASNSQHYYMTSLKDVISAIMSSGLFNSDDQINFYIAERALECTGSARPVDVVLSQMNGKLNRVNSDEQQKILTAMEFVKKYGAQGKPKTPQPVRSYNSNLKTYRENLGKNLTKFINDAFPNHNIYVEVCSAKAYCFPALADQAVNIVNYRDELGTVIPKNLDNPLLSDDNAEPIDIQSLFHYAPKHTQVKGNNVENYVEEGDFLSALNIFMNNLYDGLNAELRSLQHIFVDADENTKDDLWNTLLDICEEKMEQRGTEGDSIQKTEQLIGMLDHLITRSNCSPSNLKTLKRYYQIRGAFSAHSGKIDFEKEMEFCENIIDAREKASSFEEHQFLSKLYVDHMTGSVAQVCFNNYNFEDTIYQNLLEEYERDVMKGNPFFVKRKDFIDDDYAKIEGTIGQAFAFNGDYPNSIPAFLRDYHHSSIQKDMISSFLVIANLMTSNFDQAKEWFKKQTLAALNREIPFEEFHKEFDSDMDMWVALNYLRLAAYAITQGETTNCPDIINWNSHRKGDYPWALLLKWYAYICSMNGNNQQAISLLDESVRLLKASTNFTINSLALSPLRMLIHLSNTPAVSIVDYRELLKDLKNKSSYFSDYAEEHCFDDFDENENLWDALTMLPFNYS